MVYNVNLINNLKNHSNNTILNTVNYRSLNKSDLQTINSICYNYFKENDIIIYGGLALNQYINIYDSSDMLYSDFDIFSPNALKIAIELTNIIYNKTGKYIILGEGLNLKSYNITIEKHQLLDITYIPLQYYNIIPFNIFNGIKYASPDYLYDAFMLVFFDITNSIYRWKKDYIRFKELIKFIKYEEPTYTSNKLEFTYETNNIIKYVNNNSNIFIIGKFHYNILQSIFGDNSFLKMNYIDVMCENIQNEINKLKQIFKNITIHIYDKFYEYLPKKYAIYVNGNLIINLYEMYETNFPYYSYSNYKLPTIPMSIFLLKQMHYLKKMNGQNSSDILNTIYSFIKLSKNGFITNNPLSYFTITNIYNYIPFKCSQQTKTKTIINRILFKTKKIKTHTFVYIPSTRTDYLLNPNKIIDKKKYKYNLGKYIKKKYI